MNGGRPHGGFLFVFTLVVIAIIAVALLIPTKWGFGG